MEVTARNKAAEKIVPNVSKPGWRRTFEAGVKGAKIEQEKPTGTENGHAEASAPKEREKTPLDILKEKLGNIGGDLTKRKELREAIAEAEVLFDEIRGSHSREDIIAYQEKHNIDINDSLEVARHLADVYDQIALIGDDQRLETHLDVGGYGNIVDPHHGDATEEARMRRKEELEHTKKRAEAYKKYGQLDAGRKDEEALETEGLGADDLTLPYAKRLKLIEDKIVQRFTKIKGREPTREEFAQLIDKTGHAGSSPLSRTERAGQWFKRVGEATLGKVFDRFADTSLTQAIADYKKLEDEGADVRETYEKLDAEKREREENRRRIQEQAARIDPKTQAENLARIQARESMETPALAEVKAKGRVLSKREKELERKRRILARQELERNPLPKDLAKEEEEIAAFAQAAKENRAATDTWRRGALETMVEKRMEEWRQAQLASNDVAQDSEEWKSRESEARMRIIREIRDKHIEVRKRQGGELDTFFKRENVLGEREGVSDPYMLEDADTLPPKEPIVLGAEPPANAPEQPYTLDEDSDEEVDTGEPEEQSRKMEIPLEEKLEGVQTSLESLSGRVRPLDMPKAVEKILNDASIDWSESSAKRVLRTIKQTAAAIKLRLGKPGLIEKAREQFEAKAHGIELFLQLANKPPEERRAYIARLEANIEQLKQARPKPTEDAPKVVLDEAPVDMDLGANDARGLAVVGETSMDGKRLAERETRLALEAVVDLGKRLPKTSSKASLATQISSALETIDSPSDETLMEALRGIKTKRAAYVGMLSRPDISPSARSKYSHLRNVHDLILTLAPKTSDERKLVVAALQKEEDVQKKRARPLTVEEAQAQKLPEVSEDVLDSLIQADNNAPITEAQPREIAPRTPSEGEKDIQKNISELLESSARDIVAEDMLRDMSNADANKAKVRRLPTEKPSTPPVKDLGAAEESVRALLEEAIRSGDLEAPVAAKSPDDSGSKTEMTDEEFFDLGDAKPVLPVKAVETAAPKPLERRSEPLATMDGRLPDLNYDPDAEKYGRPVLSPASKELAVRNDGHETDMDGALEKEATGVLDKITEMAKKLPVDTSREARARFLKTNLDKIPFTQADWKENPRKRALSKLKQTRDSYLTVLRNPDLGKDVRASLTHRVGILTDILELTSRSNAGQETYVNSQKKPKGELALSLTPEQKQDRDNVRLIESKLIGEIGAILKDLPDEMPRNPTESEMYLHVYKALRQATSLKQLYALKKEWQENNGDESASNIEAFDETLRKAFSIASEAIKGRIPALQRLAGRDKDAQDRLDTTKRLPNVLELLLLKDPEEQRNAIEEGVRAEHGALAEKLATINSSIAAAKEPTNLEEQTEQRSLMQKSVDIFSTMEHIAALAEDVGIHLDSAYASSSAEPDAHEEARDRAA